MYAISCAIQITSDIKCRSDTLLIDTGSSNTWVGAAKPYVVTSTSVSTGNTIKVSYGSGSFSGTECKSLPVILCLPNLCLDTDTVTLGAGLTVTKASIGVATTATGFSGVDGILGCVFGHAPWGPLFKYGEFSSIGPSILTLGTVSNTLTVPTITDDLYSQGTISTETIGIYYAPSEPQ